MHMDEQDCSVMCRRLVLVLNSIADKMEGAHRLTGEDEGLLALAQGWAHATTHSIFFYYRCLTHTSCPHAALHTAIVAMQMADASRMLCSRTAPKASADAARKAGSCMPLTSEKVTCMGVHAAGYRCT